MRHQPLPRPTTPGPATLATATPGPTTLAATATPGPTTLAATNSPDAPSSTSGAAVISPTTGLALVDPHPANAAPAEVGSHVAAQDPDPEPITTFGVIPWLDPALDDTGHDPRSAYVETFWLPLIGPSTTLLMRRLADEFELSPTGFEIDASSLSREIGLGAKVNAKSSFARTLHRCSVFNLIRQDGSLLHVRRRVPQLSERQAAKLNTRLQALHRSWTIGDDGADGPERRTELIRGAHLARTLLALGETAHRVELQLHEWHFHPSIAWHAVQWALSEPEQLP